MNEIVTLIAARNEADTIRGIVLEMREHTDVVVVVNPSTDNTADIAQEAGATVLENETDRNIGGSLLRGYNWAVARGYRRLLQMDAGGSHLTKDALTLAHANPIPPLDLLIGSRLLPESLFQQAPKRKLITHVAARLGGIAAHGPPNDYTSGLRVFNEKGLLRAASLGITERGHAFNWMAAVRLQQDGFKLGWLPITYVSTSTSASLKSLWEAAWAFAVACGY